MNIEEQKLYEEGLELGRKGRRLRKRSFSQLPTDFIIGVVCGFFHTDREGLNKSVRKHRIVYPRQVCMYFLRKYSNESLLFIGHLFGGYDHGTVRASVEKIEDYLHVKQPDVADDVQALEKVFEARLSLRKAIAMGKMVSDAAVA